MRTEDTRCAPPALGLVVLAACAVGSEGPGVAGAEQAFEREATLTETLRIDGEEHDLTAFPRSGGVVRSPEGWIAFSQPQERTIRFFGNGGQPLGRLGGTGDGPGEFQAITSLGRAGDTLWVADVFLRRVTFIGPDRTVSRTFRVPDEVRLPGTGEAPPLAFSNFGVASAAPDGSLLLRMGRQSAHPWRVGDPDPEHLVEVGPDGGTRVVAVIPRGETSFLAAAPVPGLISVPFPSTTVVAGSVDGGLWTSALATVDGPGAETIAVTLWTAAGDTLFSRTYPFSGVPISPAVGDSVMAARREQAGSSRGPAAAAQYDAVARVPRVEPPLDPSGTVVGTDGSVWVMFRSRDGVHEYRVLDRNGEPVATLRMDDTSRILMAEGEEIWVAERDELGVESLVRYTVRWP